MTNGQLYACDNPPPVALFKGDVAMNAALCCGLVGVGMMANVEMGPNVELIRKHATRVIHGKMPMRVRKELLAAVRDGHLGRLPKDGLKPEIFFHPDHKNGAIDRQKREAEYAIGMISKVMASGDDFAQARKDLEAKIFG